MPQLPDGFWELPVQRLEEYCASGEHFVIDSRKDYGSKTRSDGFRWKQQGKRYKPASQKYEVTYLKLEPSGKEPSVQSVDDSQGTSSDSVPAHDKQMTLHVFSLDPTGSHEPEQAIATLKLKTSGNKRHRASPSIS